MPYSPACSSTASSICRALMPMLVQTAALSGAILLIVGAATGMAWAITHRAFPPSSPAGSPAMPGGAFIFMAISIVLFIVLGSILEGIPAIVLFGPLLFPMARQLGIHEVHYAMVAILAMGVGLVRAAVRCRLLRRLRHRPVQSRRRDAPHLALSAGAGGGPADRRRGALDFDRLSLIRRGGHHFPDPNRRKRSMRTDQTRPDGRHRLPRWRCRRWCGRRGQRNTPGSSAIARRPASRCISAWWRRPERIKEQSNGRMELQIFPDSQLGGDNDLLSQARSGAIEFCQPTGQILGLDPAGDRDQRAGLRLVGLSTSCGRRWMATWANTSARRSPRRPGWCRWSGCGTSASARSPPAPSRSRTADDLVGLKIRVPVAPSLVTLFKTLKAAPLALQFPEVYSALQTHIADGAGKPADADQGGQALRGAEVLLASPTTCGMATGSAATRPRGRGCRTI